MAKKKSVTGGGTFDVPYETEVVGIHAGLMRTGEVILWSFNVVPPDNPGDDPTLEGASVVLDPDTGDQVTPPVSHHVFCAGQTFLPDGRLLVAGGCDDEVDALHIFDPDSGEWSLIGTMAGWSDGTLAGDAPEIGGAPGGRWYPTSRPARRADPDLLWHDPERRPRGDPGPRSHHEQDPRDL